jgi:hypothetical protein
MVPTKVTQEMGLKDRRSQIRRRPERGQNVSHDGAITDAEPTRFAPKVGSCTEQARTCSPASRRMTDGKTD